jgi:hypothetical protein
MSALGRRPCALCRTRATPVVNVPSIQVEHTAQQFIPPQCSPSRSVARRTVVWQLARAAVVAQSGHSSISSSATAREAILRQSPTKRKREIKERSCSARGAWRAQLNCGGAGAFCLQLVLCDGAWAKRSNKYIFLPAMGEKRTAYWYCRRRCAAIR